MKNIHGEVLLLVKLQVLIAQNITYVLSVSINASKQVFTVAHKCHGKTKKPRQNKNATANQKSHGKIKKSRQTKKATAKQKSHGKPKKPRQNKNVTEK